MFSILKTLKFIHNLIIDMVKITRRKQLYKGLQKRKRKKIIKDNKKLFKIVSFNDDIVKRILKYGVFLRRSYKTLRLRKENGFRETRNTVAKQISKTNRHTPYEIIEILKFYEISYRYSPRIWKLDRKNYRFSKFKNPIFDEFYMICSSCNEEQRYPNNFCSIECHNKTKALSCK